MQIATVVGGRWEASGWYGCDAEKAIEKKARPPATHILRDSSTDARSRGGEHTQSGTRAREKERVARKSQHKVISEEEPNDAAHTLEGKRDAGERRALRELPPRARDYAPSISITHPRYESRERGSSKARANSRRECIARAC